MVRSKSNKSRKKTTKVKVNKKYQNRVNKNNQKVNQLTKKLPNVNKFIECSKNNCNEIISRNDFIKMNFEELGAHFKACQGAKNMKQCLNKQKAKSKNSKFQKLKKKRDACIKKKCGKEQAQFKKMFTRSNKKKMIAGLLR